MKAFTLALAMALLLGGTAAQAQNTQARPAIAAAKELRTYYRQNVLPVVRQQRQKLEAQLTTSDKAQLALYRAQLRENRQKTKAFRQSLRPAAGAPASPRPELTDAQKEQLQQLRAANKTIRQSVGQLAQKYEGDIARLAQEVQPQKEQWTTDTKNILARAATPEQPAKSGKWQGKRHGGPRRYFQPTSFLLLDPNAPAAAATTSASPASVYPNPAATTNQLTYEVKKAGPVTVELLDGRGNTLRTVAQEAKQEKGGHSLSVSVADLPAGTYYFKITSRTGAETQRFVKE